MPQLVHFPVLVHHKVVEQLSPYVLFGIYQVLEFVFGILSVDFGHFRDVVFQAQLHAALVRQGLIKGAGVLVNQFVILLFEFFNSLLTLLTVTLCRLLSSRHLPIFILNYCCCFSLQGLNRHVRIRLRVSKHTAETLLYFTF